MRAFRRRRRLWRDKAGGGVTPAFLFAVALAHPVVYSHFRILQGKKRKLHKKVWKKMRGCRGRRKTFPQKVFSSPLAAKQSSFITQPYFLYTALTSAPLILCHILKIAPGNAEAIPKNCFDNAAASPEFCIPTSIAMVTAVFLSHLSRRAI